MARTAPAPDVPPTPGMCPHVVVKGGGGAGGGSGGGGAGSGGGGSGGGPGGGGSGAGDGGPGAGSGSPDGNTYKPCGTKSCPIDVGTGRMYTLDEVELELPGPLPLTFARRYSSFVNRRDVGLGWGWVHSWAWEIDTSHPLRSRVYTDTGTWEDFPAMKPGEAVQGKWGWILRRERYGYVLDTGEGLLFTMCAQQGKRFRLTAIDDRNGNRILLRYQDGVLVEVTDSVGRIVKISPTSDGRIAAISVRNAEVRGQWVRFARYDYDDRGQLIEATDADGFSNRYRYDDHDRHFLVENHYKTGLVFNFRYDRKQRCVESYGAYPGRHDPSLAPGLPTQLADGQTPLRGVHHVLVEYLPDGFRHVYDSTRTESYGVNEHGLLDMANIGGSLTTSTFRDDGWQMSETDALGGTTTYERDGRGRITSVEDAIGRVTTYERDAQGLVTKIVDPAGGVTELSRDPRGNVMVIKDAAGGVTSYQRDAQGKVTAIVDARGATTHLSYDAQANLVAVVLPNGGRWHYGYDGLGRLLSRTDPLGASTHYAYSNRGDLVSERDALGNVTRYSYDGDGYLTQLVNPVGAVTKLGWGGLHKLCERVDANGHRVALRYNHEGELLQVENEEGELHHLDRDLNGLLIGERTFDDRHLRYRNDLLGRTVRVENGVGEITELEYDPASQLLRRTLHDGTAEAFTYDARGELVTATNAAGEFTFERDPLGRIVREVQKVGDEAHWVEVRYDPEGDRIGRTTSLGHQETVRRDALGARVETVLDGEVIGHTNDALGREVARLLPGGGRIETAFDPLGRVARRRALDRSASAMVPAGQPDWTGPIARGVTVDTRYRYAPDGELVETLDQARGTTEYRYDPIGQLLAMVPQQAKAEIFRYDPRGNIHEAAPGDPARVYGKGNRLLRKGATEYRWDGDGRLIEKRTAKEDGDEIWRYRWNAAGLLAEVERPDRQGVRFTYDPFARRMAKDLVRKTGAALATPVHIRYVWDAHLIVHELRNTPSGSTSDQGESTYLFADGSYEPTTMVRGGAKSYFLNDQVGCPRVIIDSHGEHLEVVGRTAWGTARLGEGEPQTINPFGLQGQYADEETGLHYNRHRFYDSATGVFVSRDPIGLAGGLNAYSFANNTLAWVDPLGLAGTNKRRRRKMRKLTEREQAPGARDRGCRTQMTRREARKAGEEWVGPGYEERVGRDGNELLISADGKRRYRGPADKAQAFDQWGQSYSRTGVQANFESGDHLGHDIPGNQNVTSNVHVDIID